MGEEDDDHIDIDEDSDIIVHEEYVKQKKRKKV